MRRSTTFAVAGVLGLALVTPVLIGSAAAALPAAPPTDRAHTAIATGAVSVDRDATGRLRSVTARSGRPLGVTGAAPGAAGARHNLTDFAPLFGVANPTADLATVASSQTGGRSVSRFQQTHHGVPVIGGQLVVTDDAAGNLVAIDGAAGDVDAVGTTATVTTAQAAHLAEVATATATRLPATGLVASAPQLSIYDPKLLGAPDPLPARAVYETTVTDPANPQVEQYVLVNAATGHIDLTFSQSGATALTALSKPAAGTATKTSGTATKTSGTATKTSGTATKASGTPAKAPDARNGATGTAPVTICDFGGVAPADGDPTCPGDVTPVANPAGSPVTDVADAYSLLGAVGSFYRTVLGRNGIDNANLPVTASVRFCPASDAFDCPYQNSYWNGSQLVFGAGFSDADDVVAHEYTHAVTQYTSGLLYYYQSGSINESMSDVLGEMFDQYNTGASAAVPGGNDGATATAQWLVGEDLPGFPQGLRNMSNPGASATGAQPASMTDAAWTDDEFDAGGVHTDSGVGNKAAYLMAKGGTLNGVTVGGMPVNTVQKTAAIWLGADQLLTPAARYADLATALTQSCANLLAAGSDQITSADCASVAAAISATKMTQAPTHSTPILQAPNCGTSTQVNLFTDSFNRTAGQALGTAWTQSGSPYISGAAAPSKAAGNAAYIPDPFPDTTPTTRYAYTTNWITLSKTHTNYLTFSHLDSFDWYDGSSPSAGGGNNEYYEGGFVDYQVSGSTAWTALPATWYNGPNKTIDTFNSSGNITGTWPGTAFGGDSRGWTSSRATIASTLAGKQVKLRFRTQSDGFDYPSTAYGWWLDDVSVNNCVKAPLAPTSVAIKGYHAQATLSWAASSVNGGSAITAYAVYVNAPGQTPVRTTLSATTRSHTFTGLANGVDYTFQIRAENTDGLYSPYVVLHLNGAKLTAAATATSIKKGSSATVKGVLTQANNGAGLSTRTITLYQRKHGTTTWAVATTTTTDSTGHYTFTVKPASSEDYYTQYSTGSGTSMGVATGTFTVTVK